MMSNSHLPERVANCRETWCRWAADSLYVFADEANQSLGMLTLPEIQHVKGHAAAQQRTLRGLKWLWGTGKARMKKFMFVDDDTFLNIPTVLQFVRKYDPRIPVAFGNVVNLRIGTWFAGGGGMIFSNAAVELIAPALFTPTCPGNVYNVEIELFRCAARMRVLRVHSEQLHWTMFDVRHCMEYPDHGIALHFCFDIHAMTYHHFYRKHTPKAVLEQYKALYCASGRYWVYPTPGEFCASGVYWNSEVAHDREAHQESMQ